MISILIWCPSEADMVVEKLQTGERLIYRASRAIENIFDK